MVSIFPPNPLKGLARKWVFVHDAEVLHQVQITASPSTVSTWHERKGGNTIKKLVFMFFLEYVFVP